jgi:hypothetical protein
MGIEDQKIGRQGYYPRVVFVGCQIQNQLYFVTQYTTVG